MQLSIFIRQELISISIVSAYNNTPFTNTYLAMEKQP